MSDEPRPKRPSPRVRIAILAIVAAAIVGLVIVLVGEGRHSRSPVGTGSATTGSGGALHAPQTPRVPTGQGSKLGGLVVDGAGVPVAGATLSVELEHGAQDRAFAAGAGSAIADAGVHDAGVAPMSAPTGVDGRFRVDGLAPGRYRVMVSGGGLLAAELRMVPVPSDEVRIVVARQVSISGIVTDGGKAVGAVIVGVRGEAIGGTLEVKTDANGGFTVPNLPEGRFQVYAYQGALAARTVRVARLGAGPFAPVELRLEAGAIVVGRVIDHDEGTGLIAAVELRPQGEDQAPRYARTGEDGVFRIEGVPNGRWIADAYAPGYLSPGGVELDAGKGVPELALVAGGTVEGRVLDGEGKPVEGATVRALTSGQNATEISALVEQDQLRRFSGRTSAAVETLGASPFANDPQFLPRGELGVMLGPIPPIPPPGAIPARPASVIDPMAAGTALVGEPPPLAITDPTRVSVWTTGADGKYRIRGLAKSKLAVLAVAGGYAEARSREVSVSPGQFVGGVDVILTAGTFIVGKVTDTHGAAIAGAQISAQPDVGSPLDAFADDDGMYRLGPLTGKVLLVASAYGHVDARRSLELASPKGKTPLEQREDITLDVADAVLAGTLDDAAGAAIPGAHIEIIEGAAEGRQVVVGADGAFSIDMLPAGKLRVRVTHPAYPTAELDAVATRTGTPQRLRLALGGQVEGVLLDDSTGAPITGMTVDATSAGGLTADAVTDAKGLWRLGPLRPGAWKIEVKLPGYLPASQSVDVKAGSAPGVTTVRDVRLELRRGATIGGTVRDRRGQRLAGAHVTVRRADGTTTDAEADTDAQGEFRIHDCPTGELVIGAALGDAGGSTRANVRPGDELLSLSIELR